MNCDGFSLSTLRLYQSVIREVLLLPEDVQHQSNSFEAQHIIAIGGYLDFELRRFLFPIDNWSFSFRGILIQLDSEVKAQLLEFVLGEAITLVSLSYLSSQRTYSWPRALNSSTLSTLMVGILRLILSPSFKYAQKMFVAVYDSKSRHPQSVFLNRLLLAG